MKLRRPWLAVALALFCLPLFVDLGRTDVGHDEAIYSFAVDRILESGDWLEPKSLPSEDEAFLEKPPLKFWIVAAPMRLGLLPHDELGLRLWDALFGALAFAYVFAIGCALAGPVCGTISLLVLFVHWPLLFEHGLRSNNMEAPLFLSYCGGIYHFMRWAHGPVGRVGAELAPPKLALPEPELASPDDRARSASPIVPPGAHAIAVALYFVLGFMTKFVAAMFLPLVLVTTTLIFSETRARLWQDWRLWLKVSLLALVLIAPWFIYASVRFGSYFWHVILTEHVYTRFTTFLDPIHVQPWSYYFTEMYRRFAESGAAWLVIVGLAVLAVQTIRRRWFDGAVVVLWFAMPLVLISAGTSKIYHYAYPFLPPAALAAGYVAALVARLAPAPLARVLQAISAVAVARAPAALAILKRPAVRATMLAIAAMAAIVAAVTVIYGPIRVAVEQTVVFKSSGLIRPLAVVALFGALPAAGWRASRFVVALFVLSVLPLQEYRETWRRLTIDDHPMRSATDCLNRVERRMGNAAPGLYLDLPDMYISHPLYYYFRRVRPWSRPQTSDPAVIARALNDPAESKPMLVWDSTYQKLMNAMASVDFARPASPPMVALPDVVLLLPGPYAACSAPALDRAKVR
jgi:4-amino-4-deoxy-L-arabinose transferase-like glycosyltransferase